MKLPVFSTGWPPFASFGVNERPLMKVFKRPVHRVTGGSGCTVMSRKDQHRNYLRSYLDQSGLTLLWIATVLQDCSIEEFDEHIAALEPTHGNYVTWSDIPKVRSALRQRN
ncbi:MAG: hypothetical protein RTU92_11355 [Candidatus Thorarchaeota archaeon]